MNYGIALMNTGSTFALFLIFINIHSERELLIQQQKNSLVDALLDKEPIPFERELARPQYYLELEKRRFGERLKVVLILAQRISGCPLFPC